MTCRISQFGTQRSGTNYTRDLLHQNLDIEVIQGFPNERWKQHGVVTEAQVNKNPHGVDGYIVNVKNPYAWMDSMIRWRQGCAEQWPEWDHPYPPVDWTWKNGAYFVEDQCLIWNATYEAWFQTLPNFTLFRHEDMIDPHDAEMQIMTFARKYGLKFKGGGFTPISKHVGPSERFSKDRFDPKPYEDKTYLDRMDDRLVERITEQINWNVAALMGYKPLA